MQNELVTTLADLATELQVLYGTHVHIQAGQSAEFGAQAFQHLLHRGTLTLGLEVQEHATVVGLIAIAASPTHKRHHAQHIGTVLDHLSRFVLQLEHGPKRNILSSLGGQQHLTQIFFWKESLRHPDVHGNRHHKRANRHAQQMALMIEAPI